MELDNVTLDMHAEASGSPLGSPPGTAAAARALDLEMYSENSPSSGITALPKNRHANGLRRLAKNGPRESDMGRYATPNNGEDNDRPLGQIDSDLDLMSEIPVDSTSPRSTFNGRRSTTNMSIASGRMSNQISFERVSFKRLTAGRRTEDSRAMSPSSPRGTRGQTSTEEGPATTESWWASTVPTSGLTSSSSSTVVAGAASLLRSLEANGGLTDVDAFVDDSLLSELPQDVYSKKHVTPGGNLSSSSMMFWNSNLQGAGAASSSLSRAQEERRIDPEHGTAVTYDEMCRALRHHHVSTDQLHEHWANLKPKAQQDSFDMFSSSPGQHLDLVSDACSAPMPFSHRAKQSSAPLSGWQQDADSLDLLSPSPTAKESKSVCQQSVCQQSTIADLSSIKEGSNSVTDSLDSRHLEAYLRSCSSRQCTISSDLDLIAGKAVSAGSVGAGSAEAYDAASVEAYLSACSSSKPTTLNTDLDVLAEKALSFPPTACSSRVVSQTDDIDVMAHLAAAEGGRSFTADSEDWEALHAMPNIEEDSHEPQTVPGGNLEPVMDLMEEERSSWGAALDDNLGSQPSGGVPLVRPVPPASSPPDRVRPTRLRGGLH